MVEFSQSIKGQYWYPQLGVYMPLEDKDVTAQYTAYSVSIVGSTDTAMILEAFFKVEVDGHLIPGYLDRQLQVPLGSTDLLAAAEAALLEFLQTPEEDTTAEYEYNDTAAITIPGIDSV